MSFEIMRSELDLFKKVQFQASIENSQFVEYRPTSSINDTSTVDFEIPISSDEYLDLQNVYLFIKGSVRNVANAAFAAGDDDKYSLVNYALNTIFDQLTIYLGGTLVSQSSKTYHYLSYIEALLQNNILSSKTDLKSAGFLSFFEKDNYNPEAIEPKLFNQVKQSKTFSLYGKIHGAIFKSDRLMLNGISMHLSFTRAPNEFCIMTTRTAAGVPEVTPLLDISHMSLFVRKVKLTPNLLNAHARALSSTKALYPIKRSTIKVINLPANQNAFVLDNIHMGQLPCKLVFGLVTNDAFSGSYITNPFAFKHNDLTFIAIHVNGEMWPKTPYTPDFRDNQNLYEREYYDFLLNLGVTNTLSQPPIDFDNYKKAFCLFAFNLNPDFENPEESDYINLSKEGILNIELKFRANLANALKLVVYSQFDNLIEIDESRNVTVDYA